jgi:hypothetical protein
VKTTRQTHRCSGTAPLTCLRVLGMVLAVAALLAGPRLALAQQAVTAQLGAQGGSGVTGTATFTAAGDAAHAPRQEDATQVSLALSGLPAGASAQGSVQAGTCATPGASAAMLPNLTADGGGRASAGGFVQFRGAENVAFPIVVEGGHIVSIVSGGRVVACGAIPRAAGVASPLPTGAGAQAACTFQLGFKAIADQIGREVGQCLENEHFNPANGNAEQRTTAHHGQGGLLVWRKADNWTAFTDGYWTWVNGPNGLQRRLNTERFDFEAPPGSGAAPTASPMPPAPPAAAGTVPDSREATDNLYNCPDFPSQADAQAFLRRYPNDPSQLDTDRDGIACETNRAPFDRAPVAR